MKNFPARGMLPRQNIAIGARQYYIKNQNRTGTDNNYSLRTHCLPSPELPHVMDGCRVLLVLLLRSGHNSDE
ncbi:MAG: hypothetical protein ACJ8AW_22460 [Rhodopila sp.]